MIVVVGPPRSGTSLVMQTLVHLGYIPQGEQFPMHRDRELNPHGYWEGKEILANRKWAPIKDGCCKMMLGSWTKNPRPDCKVILCHRTIKKIIESQQRFGLEPNVERTKAKLHQAFQEFAWATDAIGVEWIAIDLDAWRNEPAIGVEHISNFLRPLPERGIVAAINNVRGTHANVLC